MKFTRLTTTSMFEKPVEKKTYNWRFGKRSESKIAGINPELEKVTRRALELSPVDFGVTCGLRTQHEQNQLRAQGKSQIKHSRHQDGMAVDVVAYEGSSITWDLDKYIIIAQAFAEAARELNVTIRWGGAWTHYLNDNDAKAAHEAYVSLRKSQGRRPFIDGPHFEIPK